MKDIIDYEDMYDYFKYRGIWYRENDTISSIDIASFITVCMNSGSMYTINKDNFQKWTILQYLKNEVEK